MNTLRVHALISMLGFGGAETLLADFAAAAPAVGVELSVTYLQPADGRGTAQQLRELGIEPVLVPFRRLARASDHRAVRARLAAVPADLVHTHLMTADLVGGIAARRLGLPQVSTLHGFDWDPQDWGTSLRARGGRKLVMTARRRLARRLIAPSHALAQGYLERTGDAPAHVVTIQSGSACVAQPGSGAALRAQLGIGCGEFVVAMVSWLHPLKGHRVALEAAARLAERVPSLRLLIAGEGPEQQSLRADAARLAPATIFTGYRTDVMALLDAADVLLHPSRMEGFPIALLEALAAGVPIVATRVGGVPEIVEDGVSGLLVEPPATPQPLADALALLHGDPALRARLAEAGRRRYAERFTVERWAQRLRDFYDAELARR